MQNIYYHGSRKNFESFSLINLGKNTIGNSSFGVCLTSNESEAEGYADNGYVYTTEAYLKKELSTTRVTLEENFIFSILIKLHDLCGLLDDFDYECTGDLQEMKLNALNYLRKFTTDVEIINEISKVSCNKRAVRNFLIKHGYNYYKIRKNNRTELVVFDVKSLSIIDKRRI